MFLYLHGFASGPSSHKARVFREHFAARGIELAVPALDEGDFEHLTIGRQRALLERLCRDAPRPHVLIGSSLGGYLAALHASRHPVDALVLLAPAVDFAARWRERLQDHGLEAWRRRGFMQVEHHATGKLERLSWEFSREAAEHEPWPRISCPALVLHGRHDELVPLDRVERWSRENGATLLVREEGHELTEDPAGLVEEARRFLSGLPEVSKACPRLS